MHKALAGVVTLAVALAGAATAQTTDVQPGASAVQTAGTPGAAAVAAASSAAAPAVPAAALPVGGYLQRQGFDCSDFKRAADGGWTATRAVSFPAPSGSLKIDAGAVHRPGQFDAGYDLGAMLEHDCPR